MVVVIATAYKAMNNYPGGKVYWAHEHIVSRYTHLLQLKFGRPNSYGIGEERAEGNREERNKTIYSIPSRKQRQKRRSLQAEGRCHTMHGFGRINILGQK